MEGLSRIKRRGSVLIEVMIGLLIFSTGLLALTSAMAFALRGIKESGERMVPRQGVFNKAAHYMARRAFMHDNDAATSGGSSIQEVTFTLGAGNTKKIKLYKFAPGGGDSYTIYVAEGEN